MIVEVHNVYLRRNKKEILTNINWNILSGQHWTVLGLNGSGKTTLLNMINGYIWPSEGTISVLGYKFGEVNVRDLRKKIGWVSSAIGVRINGRQFTQYIVVSGKYASIGLYDEPSDHDYEKAYDLMGQLGCEHLIDQPYEICSTGEKQRILIARSLMASPELLILDEPTSGLDFIAREDLLLSIQHLASGENAPTIILVTHHIEEIIPIFSHSLLLKQGEVFTKGKSEEVLTSENLSQFFDVPIRLNWYNNRPWMST